MHIIKTEGAVQKMPLHLHSYCAPPVLTDLTSSITAPARRSEQLGTAALTPATAWARHLQTAGLAPSHNALERSQQDLFHLKGIGVTCRWYKKVKSCGICSTATLVLVVHFYLSAFPSHTHTFLFFQNFSRGKGSAQAISMFAVKKGLDTAECKVTYCCTQG